MGKIYAVTSGKGGVGKSTVSFGLALAFEKSEKKVLLVDMDEGLRCLDLMLGVEQNVVFDLSDVLMGKSINDALYKSEAYENLFLIPAPSKIGLINQFALKTFVDEVTDLFDVIIFDFPAGIDFSLYSCLSDKALFLTVAFPDPVSVRDAAAVSEELMLKSLSSKLIINNFDYKFQKKKYGVTIDDMIDTSSLQLIGIVPKSESLSLLCINHTIDYDTKAFKSFLRIISRLEGQHILLPKLKKI